MPTGTDPVRPPARTARLRVQIVLFTAMRVLINTAFRIVYPLAPAFMAGLNIDFAQYSTALQIRSWAGGLGPILAALADRFGRKIGMLFGVLLVIGGLVVVVIFPTYWGFLVSLLLVLLGKYVFDPALLAYLGDRVPYDRRGLVIALTEFGWSGATLVGIPLAGLVITRFGWVAPFPLIIILSSLLLAAIFIYVPSDRAAGRAGNPFAHFRVVFSSLSAIAGLSITLSLSTANEIVNLVFGVWLQASFNLNIAALGASTIVIGLAELLGEGLVSAFTDRLGKRRAIIIGLLFNSGFALLLPVIGRTELGAFIGLFLFYLSFEFTFVSTIPMMTEILPAARATFLALTSASASIGRALAAIVTPIVFTAWGFAAAAVLSALVNLLALIALRIIILPEDGR
jgi:predicted MFS family arabinose efflux permease